MKWIAPIARLLSPSRRRRDRTARAVYDHAVDQARRPAFYASLGVPDTIEGRFDLLSLHVGMVCRRLARTGLPGQHLAQSLFDTMFSDMEDNLREIGVSETALGRSVKTMAKGFLGRAGSYGRALDGDESLDAVLRRNLYAGTETAPGQVEAMSAYVEAAMAKLDSCSYEDVARATGLFPEPVAGESAAADRI